MEAGTSVRSDRALRDRFQKICCVDSSSNTTFPFLAKISRSVMEIMFRFHSFMLHEIQQVRFRITSCGRKITPVSNFTSSVPAVCNG